MIRDQWVRDTLIHMGHACAGQGTYAHVYLNGMYWGLYNVHERQEASHYAAYFDGDSEGVDALSSGAPTDGTKASWDALHNRVAQAVSGGMTLAEYQQIQERLVTGKHTFCHGLCCSGNRLQFLVTGVNTLTCCCKRCIIG